MRPRNSGSWRATQSPTAYSGSRERRKFFTKTISASSSGQLGAAVFLGKVKFEELLEFHAFEEIIDDRQRADRPGLQGVVAAFRQVAATAAGATAV